VSPPPTYPRIIQEPVLAAFAREHPTGVLAAHGHDHVCRAEDLLVPRVRDLSGDVDAYLGDGLDDGKAGGSGTGRFPVVSLREVLA
jgi:L-ascorbate metabolism protein UlaG (beta-lactamase superfamily)